MTPAGRHLATATVGLFEHVGDLAAPIASTGYRMSLDGARYTTDRDVRAAIDATHGGGSSRLDLGRAREAVEALPWVLTADVRRTSFDTLAVTVVERKPVALWRSSDGDVLIDRTGRRLAVVSAGSDVGLPVVVGAGADAAAKALLASLAEYPRLSGLVVEAHRIADRRWTLALASGTRIMLPADGLAAALAWIAAGPGAELLEADLERIDLRVPGQLVVRRRTAASVSTSGASQGAERSLPKAPLPRAGD